MKLVSGALAVSGDQWPLMVYANQKYDPEDPWDGLFKSQLLVCVGIFVSFISNANFVVHRRSSTSLHRPVLWRKRRKRPDRETLAYTA
jgi:hypothetical protein